MSDLATTPWLVCRLRRPEAAVRLYCFPHSGGSPGEFVRWTDRLPEAEVLGVQLPGRGARLTELALSDVHAMAVALADSVDFRAPFAFFGHSLGALVAYETALVLRARGRSLPGWLFVSACPGPHVPCRMASLADLPDAEMLDWIEGRYGPLGVELRDDPELMALVLPAYRADFAAAETYEYVPRAPLDIPVTAAGGLDDEVTEDDLRAWARHTTGPFTLNQYPGGHFYLRAQADALLGTVSRALRQVEVRPGPRQTGQVRT
ncbi:MAG: alpha/beta fold hydrolase [Pseudonocardiaceae bacterium]|jgi:surfactin synthase thioesterase subunit|nr:alpha/beta fold hydrolase [Pseudonocardiaceae bacterium]